MNKICKIKISENPITDLAPLVDLPNLKILELDYCPVSALKDIAQMVSLEKLNIDGYKGNDITSLTNLKDLTTLEIHNVNIDDEQVNYIRQSLPNCEIILND